LEVGGGDSSDWGPTSCELRLVISTPLPLFLFCFFYALCFFVSGKLIFLYLIYHDFAKIYGPAQI
jgi:hypothetical protein